VAHNPTALADMVWGLFCGTVLWEETKRMINAERYQLKESIRTGFDLLRRGLKIHRDLD
jgi:hypothetical protein